MRLWVDLPSAEASLLGMQVVGCLFLMSSHGHPCLCVSPVSVYLSKSPPPFAPPFFFGGTLWHIGSL